jgi:hypothetical protein
VIESTVTRVADDTRAATSSHRLRVAVSIVLAVVASLMALAGGVALYARDEIVDQSAFADRAVDAVHQPVLQRVLAREIAVQLVEPSLADAIAARPVVESAVKLVIGSTPFVPVIHLAAEHGHRLLFERGGGNAVFDVADAGTVVSSALHTLAPGLAREIPRRTDAVLLALRRRSFAAETLRFADHVRLLGIVLPALAIVLLTLSVLAAPNRRTAITRSAVAIGVTGVAFVIAFEVARHYVVSHTYGSNELTNADVRGAVGELWDVYLGDLRTATVAASAVAWLVAATSASLLAPYSPATGLRQLRGLAHRPVYARTRTARGAITLAIGLMVILEPTLALRVLAIACGCLLIYVGVGEVLTATAPAQPRVRPPRPRRARRGVAVGALGAALAAGVIVAFALTAGAAKVKASPVLTCNGYAKLCPRRLDEVVFAGTHNSMSAADSPGWLIANQDRTIAQQLQDGIRAFKISTHYGTADSSGRVITDITAEGQRLNRVAAKLTPAARHALQRVSRSLTAGTLDKSKRDIWLCHTLCELGATRMVTYLTTIKRFLDRNPDQVIVLFDEDYVSERDLQSAFKRSGLLRHLATLQRGQPLPTLASLIRSRHNVLVFAQKPPSGKYPWDMDAFSWIQDTPLGARKASQFTCRLYRGRPANPLLMMNDWADIFPPRPTPNLPLVKRAFILTRARQCVAQRGLIPNLILTDYYNRGDVVGAVAELNGVAGQRAAAIVPWT